MQTSDRKLYQRINFEGIVDLFGCRKQKATKVDVKLQLYWLGQLCCSALSCKIFFRRLGDFLARAEAALGTPKLCMMYLLLPTPRWFHRRWGSMPLWLSLSPCQALYVDVARRDGYLGECGHYWVVALVMQIMSSC
jgi:hypothetical protein